VARTSRRRGWVVGVAFLLGCLVAGGVAWALTSNQRESHRDAIARLDRQVTGLEASNRELRDALEAARQRARAAERDAEEARRKAARDRARREGRSNKAGAVGKVAINWGGWDGLFEMTDAVVKASDGRAAVVGHLEYLGGGACDVGYIELTATFLDGEREVGSGSWSAPAIAVGEPVRVKASGDVSRAPDRARLLMSDARCAP
jgi:outer membrane murein-binding lipoprotein Lpp